MKFFPKFKPVFLSEVIHEFFEDFKKIFIALKNDSKRPKQKE